jgi:O-succinylbenzoate synthase
MAGGTSMGRRTIPFDVALRIPVGSLRRRRGLLIEGAAGWGECSPLPSWSESERAAAMRSAEGAADARFPAPRRERVAVNVMIPRVPPDQAGAMVAESGCRTAKVKVGDEFDVDRVAAVRDALGPSGRLRLDANGSWPDAGTAAERLRRFAAYDIELIEDPVPEMDELARARRSSPIAVAAEMCVRTVDDAARLGRVGGADVLVIKPQRIGGVSAALAAAEAARAPAIASSALETSVGLAAVLAVAAALPDAPFAHGIGTATFLLSDVSAEPLVPVDGWLAPRRVAPDLLMEETGD